MVAQILESFRAMVQNVTFANRGGKRPATAIPGEIQLMLWFRAVKMEDGDVDDAIKVSELLRLGVF